MDPNVSEIIKLRVEKTADENNRVLNEKIRFL